MVLTGTSVVSSQKHTFI